MLVFILCFTLSLLVFQNLKCSAEWNHTFKIEKPFPPSARFPSAGGLVLIKCQKLIYVQPYIPHRKGMHRWRKPGWGLFLSLCSVITCSGSVCLQRDLQKAEGRKYNRAKNKMWGSEQPSILSWELTTWTVMDKVSWAGTNPELKEPFGFEEHR